MCPVVTSHCSCRVSRGQRESKEANSCPSSSPCQSSLAGHAARMHSWGQIGRAAEVQGQTTGLVGDVCWGLQGRGDGECNELREWGSWQKNALRARRWMNMGSQRTGEVFFSAEARPHFTIKLYKHKLEVKWKYIYLVQAIELENTMEINSPAAVLKSPEVSLSLPQAITWKKLPVWFLKCCTMEKKNATTGFLEFLMFYTRPSCDYTQCPHFPLVSFEGMQISCSFSTSWWPKKALNCGENFRYLLWQEKYQASMGKRYF